MDDRQNALTAETLLRIANENRKISKRNGAFGDLREALIRARPYRLWKQLLVYLRRIRMISILIRVVSVIFSVLQAGTLVILTTAVLFILLPILLLLLTLGTVAALVDRRRSLRILERELTDKRVYVFFCIRGGFGEENARSLARSGDVAVLVVSPHWISPTAFGSRRPFVNLRREEESLFLIRRYFYFSVRKRLDPSRLTLVF